MAISTVGNDLENIQLKMNDPAWGTEQLRGVSLFSAFTDTELSALYQQGSIKTIEAKAHVVIEGESTRGLYLLLFGTVSVYKTDNIKNHMIRLAYLESGSAFGELSLFDDAPRSATVVSESRCILFYLEEKVFSEFLNESGDGLKTRFYKTCAEDMAARFRIQNGDYVISQKLLWSYALRKKDKETSEKSLEET